jgi:acyl carrier protein phosphodiesterase
MNLLAHAALAGDDPGGVVGGLVADLVKGPVPDAFSRAIGDGIRLHRRIDVFTDAHPVTARSRARLRAGWGRYSGILTDVAYDYCLAHQWSRHRDDTLEEFVGRVYRMVEASLPELPSPLQGYARRMIEEDWLTSYGRWDGVERALRRISARLRRPVDLAAAVGDLQRAEADLMGDFETFFPEVARHAGLLY